MLSTDVSPLIWLSMNSSRVCTLEFGKAASACSSAAAFASDSPPAISMKMNRSFGCGFSSSQVAAEIVTWPNGEPPVGGSKIPLTVNVRRHARDERDGDLRAERELVVLGEVVVDERAVLRRACRARRPSPRSSRA